MTKAFIIPSRLSNLRSILVKSCSALLAVGFVGLATPMSFAHPDTDAEVITINAKLSSQNSALTVIPTLYTATSLQLVTAVKALIADAIAAGGGDTAIQAKINEIVGTVVHARPTFAGAVTKGAAAALGPQTVGGTSNVRFASGMAAAAVKEAPTLASVLATNIVGGLLLPKVPAKTNPPTPEVPPVNGGSEVGLVVASLISAHNTYALNNGISLFSAPLITKSAIAAAKVTPDTVVTTGLTAAQITAAKLAANQAAADATAANITRIISNSLASVDQRYASTVLATAITANTTVTVQSSGTVTANFDGPKTVLTAAVTAVKARAGELATVAALVNYAKGDPRVNELRDAAIGIPGLTASQKDEAWLGVESVKVIKQAIAGAADQVVAIGNLISSTTQHRPGTTSMANSDYVDAILASAATVTAGKAALFVEKGLQLVNDTTKAQNIVTRVANVAPKQAAAIAEKALSNRPAGEAPALVAGILSSVQAVAPNSQAGAVTTKVLSPTFGLKVGTVVTPWLTQSDRNAVLSAAIAAVPTQADDIMSAAIKTVPTAVPKTGPNVNDETRRNYVIIGINAIPSGDAAIEIPALVAAALNANGAVTYTAFKAPTMTLPAVPGTRVITGLALQSNIDIIIGDASFSGKPAVQSAIQAARDAVVAVKTDLLTNSLGSLPNGDPNAPAGNKYAPALIADLYANHPNDKLAISIATLLTAPALQASGVAAASIGESGLSGTALSDFAASVRLAASRTQTAKMVGINAATNATEAVMVAGGNSANQGVVKDLIRYRVRDDATNVGDIVTGGVFGARKRAAEVAYGGATSAPLKGGIIVSAAIIAARLKDVPYTGPAQSYSGPDGTHPSSTDPQFQSNQHQTLAAAAITSATVSAVLDAIVPTGATQAAIDAAAKSEAAQVKAITTSAVTAALAATARSFTNLAVRSATTYNKAYSITDDRIEAQQVRGATAGVVASIDTSVTGANSTYNENVIRSIASAATKAAKVYADEVANAIGLVLGVRGTTDPTRDDVIVTEILTALGVTALSASFSSEFTRIKNAFSYGATLGGSASEKATPGTLANFVSNHGLVSGTVTNTPVTDIQGL